MRITLDKNKYRKRMIPLWFGTITFGLATILVVVMNLLINKGLNAERISVVFGLMLLFTIFAYLTKFYYSIRKIKHAVVYENGVLNDFSKRFNKVVDLHIENIKSISIWSSNRGITQYKIVTKKHNPKLNGLMNQLKGNYMYLTDYIVDSEEFKKLVVLLDSECD